ncbi:hypothetical protein NM688_g4973 [Phlebia brevispora]|uniref:Uncharacterized protein n=1 Tax=Phlebia brevispora TaxID=194682 RepID=A0ACC1T1F2_9APHY|nr:hypothetical protein NM688_g4973 [Phlebia brevispora]
MTAPDEPVRIATEWFAAYSDALQSGKPEAVAASFLPQGWLRDALTFTWDTRSLEGREKITNYLSETLATAKIHGLKMDDDLYFRPAYFQFGPFQGISFGYSFETPIALGRGFVQLFPEGGGEQWKAQVVSIMLTDLKGHEEQGRTNYEDVVNGRTWGEYRAEYEAKVQSDPYVIVIGAGQVGLQVAARFKQNDIPTLVVERNNRVGDNWRKRYDSLALHTIPEHHQMLYQPLPTNWPKYPPRDRVAGLLETYVTTQELTVWTRSYPVGRPVYSPEAKRWTVVISHDGQEVELHPAHIVLATGTLGAPHIPSYADRDVFKGPVIHSTAYANPTPFKGKDVVVVGSGQSAVDICEDLAKAGISVTMIQRAPTTVSGRDWEMANVVSLSFPKGVPAEVMDFKFASMPRGHLCNMIMSKEAMAVYVAAQADLHAKLRKAGVILNLEKPQAVLWFERMGGYWMDKGSADLFASGDIKVKAGVEPTAYTSTGFRLSDGSELRADAIILATGYLNMREVNKTLFGADVIDKTSAVWGMDEEGEICGSYRPSGYPGLWYASGDFYNARYGSKHLALQIKAIALGLHSQ